LSRLVARVTRRSTERQVNDEDSPRPGRPERHLFDLARAGAES
jgi:hypothetical protein